MEPKRSFEPDSINSEYNGSNKRGDEEDKEYLESIGTDEIRVNLGLIQTNRDRKMTQIAFSSACQVNIPLNKKISTRISEFEPSDEQLQVNLDSSRGLLEIKQITTTSNRNRVSAVPPLHHYREEDDESYTYGVAGSAVNDENSLFSHQQFHFVNPIRRMGTQSFITTIPQKK